MEENNKIGGIMQSDGRALLRIMSVPDHASVAGTVFKAMGGNGINIELLVESYDLDDCGNFAVVIDQKDLDHALEVLDELKPTIDAKAISYTPDVAVITVFAPHLREKPRIHGMMFSSIASVGISSLAISTSLSSVSCVVEGQHLNATIQALTEAFDIPYDVKERPKDY
jgi:aspartate kinase